MSYEPLPLEWIFFFTVGGIVTALLVFNGTYHLWRTLTGKEKAEFEERRRKEEQVHQQLIYIDGHDSWSIDDIDLRILKIERALNPEDTFSRMDLALYPRRREEMEDTLFRLKRISERRHKYEDGNPPETIIGFERD
jgi:hypothetical protein